MSKDGDYNARLEKIESDLSYVIQHLDSWLKKDKQSISPFDSAPAITCSQCGLPQASSPLHYCDRVQCPMGLNSAR